jgi:MiaB-like tRNA modifying enzyme
MKNSFCLITYGCKLNQADSEIIRAILLDNNFKETSLVEADFLILNTCGVVEKTERNILKQAREAKNQGQKVILTGCLPGVVIDQCKKVADAILGVKNINLIVEAIREISKGKQFIFLEENNFDKLRIKKTEKATLENVSTVVAISEGCLGGCSYCATKLARKKLKSFSSKNIINEIKLKLNFGFKEIQLTSQDLGIFGLDHKDSKQNLPQLLSEIDNIPEEFKVKLGMMNPGHAKKIFKDLLKILKSPKFYKFLHIPLQSGSDDVLKQMNRGNSVKEFLDLVDQFKKAFPDGIIATDIIVGHPTENEKDFKKTVAVIKKVKPDVLHIFKFSKRQGTSDFKLKDIPDRIKKDRSRILNKIFEEYNLKRNKKFLKTEQEVLVVRKKGQSFLSRNNDGRAIVLKSAKIGCVEEVKISDFRYNYLLADELGKK